MKVAKNNFVVMRLAASGHKQDSQVKEIVFLIQPSMCILTTYCFIAN